MNRRIDAEPAFLIATTPWRESSSRIEVFTKNHGRQALLARSARKRQSDLRGVLVPFVPILVSWYGQNELRTLHRASWIGGWAQPTGNNLMGALYINELVLKLTAYEDSHEEIYHAMYRAMSSLANATHIQGILRIFEWQLLTACGIAPDAKYDINGKEIVDDTCYIIQPESLAQVADDKLLNPDETSNQVLIHGSTLKALQNSKFDSDESLSEALRLNRMLLNFRIPQICSRNILQQLQIIKKSHLIKKDNKC
ncbi:MAG: DNA repair protein RecO [Neisseriaceae bacterium]|nr:DNA repair protein RecO [Neisseriaceae bacterium]